jgi:hypothetical protein
VKLAIPRFDSVTTSSTASKGQGNGPTPMIAFYTPDAATPPHGARRPRSVGFAGARCPRLPVPPDDERRERERGHMLAGLSGRALTPATGPEPCWRARLSASNGWKNGQTYRRATPTISNDDDWLKVDRSPFVNFSAPTNRPSSVPLSGRKFPPALMSLTQPQRSTLMTLR